MYKTVLELTIPTYLYGPLQVSSGGVFFLAILTDSPIGTRFTNALHYLLINMGE